MATSSVIKSLSALTSVEIMILFLFLVVFLLPYEMPYSLGFVIDSAFGMIILFLMTVGFFVFFNPILGVLFLLVSYDLIRRSAAINPHSPVISYTPTQDKKDKLMELMNPEPATSLEEEIVRINAPVDGSKTTMSFVVEPSTYKPIMMSK